MSVWTDLKERRIAQFFITYCAIGWAFLTVVDQVVDRSVLPELAYRVALTLFIAGLPGALIVSWFHGARGRQTVPLAEKWLLAGVVVMALAASGLVVRAGIAEPQPTDPMAELTPERDPRRVAVLYFDTRGGGEDAEFMAAGLTEALIDELSPVPQLEVISKNGSQLYRDANVAPDSIGRGLGVGTLVNGTVQVAGDQVRVTVSMIESQSGRQLRSQEVTKPRADLFALQDELATQVAEFLREEIGVEVGQIQARGGTRSVQAWEQFQRAQEVARGAEPLTAAGDVRGASRELLRADSILALAEATDPDWLKPVTERGWLAYEQSRFRGFDRTEIDQWIDTGLGHAARALQREPNDADALELDATLVYWRYLLNLSPDPAASLEHAERGFRASVNANPEQASALTSLSHLLNNRGNIAQAKLTAQRSYEADPFLENANLTLWRLFGASWDLGDLIESRKWCNEGSRRFAQDYRFSQCQLMLFALPQAPADIDAAWGYQRSFVELSPPATREFNEKKGLMYLAMALVRADLPDSAEAVAVRGRAGADIDPVRDLAMLEAIVRTWVGDIDEAVQLLGLYLTANPGMRAGYRAAVEGGLLQWYFQPLADEPAFRELVGSS